MALKQQIKPEEKRTVPVADGTPYRERRHRPFTGIARSVECFGVAGNNSDDFKDFRIVTIYLENDKIVKKEYSDPYAIYEVMGKLELANDIACINLNANWKEGATLSK